MLLLLPTEKVEFGLQRIKSGNLGIQVTCIGLQMRGTFHFLGFQTMMYIYIYICFSRLLNGLLGFKKLIIWRL